MPELSDVAGAYILAIDLDAELTFEQCGSRTAVLRPGRYAYCGSAHGPGGIRARVLRHLRRDKRPHWHVDRLTGAGRIAAVHVVPGGRECDLLDHVLAVPGAVTPIAGFGSTDCQRCPAHLARLPAKMDDRPIAQLLAEIFGKGDTC